MSHTYNMIKNRLNILVFILLSVFSGCTYPYLSVSRDGDNIIVSDGICGNLDLSIPTKYIEYKYERTKEEKEADEKRVFEDATNVLTALAVPISFLTEHTTAIT